MTNEDIAIRELVARADRAVSLDLLSRESLGGSGIVAGAFYDALHAVGETLDRAILMTTSPSGYAELALGHAIGSARRARLHRERAVYWIEAAQRYLAFIERNCEC